jgi:hypothetical protein
VDDGRWPAPRMCSAVGRADLCLIVRSFLNPRSLVRLAGITRPRRCRPTSASFSMTARAAGPFSSQRMGTAAFSAPMAMWLVRLFRKRVNPAVQPEGIFKLSHSPKPPQLANTLVAMISPWGL